MTNETFEYLRPYNNASLRGYFDFLFNNFINPFPYGTKEYSEWIEGFDKSINDVLTTDMSLFMYNNKVELKSYTEKLMKFMCKYIKGE